MAPTSCSTSLLTALTFQVLLFLHAAASGAQAGSSAFSSDGADAYEAFRQAFGRAALADDNSVDYETRLALFQQRRAEVEAHNALPQKSWVAAVNKFSDYTEEEKRALFGYRRSATGRPSSSAEGGSADDADGAGSSGGGSFLEVQPRIHGANLATTVDWRAKLTRTTTKSFIREQGACGSCWAVAAAGALETHAELAGLPPMKLSYEQLVDCTPNPQHCGGDGACKGATGELAFAFVQKEGVVPASAYAGYQHGGDGRCKLDANKQMSVRIAGWTKLPDNRVAPLLEAVAKKGPIVVSVDAGLWTSYASGVFDACSRDATVNHAVLMVGYGTDREVGKKYWLIRNSWGGDWGEDGYMRLERHSSDQGDQGYCGTDYDPKQGVGCDGGPRSIPVCGMCGILSDTSYPYGLSLVKGE